MDNETALRAIEPFFTTKPVGQGSGLGLSMAYGFARQSGGHFLIESEKGVGTRVRLCLPRGEGRAPVRADAADDLPEFSGLKVLIVEDDPSVRTTMERFLRSLGCEPMAAADGDEALRITQENADFELFLLDVILPGTIGGRVLADLMEKACPGARTLFMSGYTDNRDLRAAVGSGEVHLLQKPFNRAALAEAIDRVLKAPESVDEAPPAG